MWGFMRERLRGEVARIRRQVVIGPTHFRRGVTTKLKGFN